VNWLYAAAQVTNSRSWKRHATLGGVDVFRERHAA